MGWREYGAMLAVSLAASGATFWIADSRSEDRAAADGRLTRNVFTEVCERNNINKADSRWRVKQATSAFGSQEAYERETAREDSLLVILNCVATFAHDGRGVPLAPSQDDKYVDIIGTGRIPDVSAAGVVTGSHVPESGPQADF